MEKNDNPNMQFAVLQLEGEVKVEVEGKLVSQPC
jgi:hypothetical protein